MRTVLLLALGSAICEGFTLRQGAPLPEPVELSLVQPGLPGDSLQEVEAWLSDRQEEYEKRHHRWGRRGAAWLRQQKGLLLALRLDAAQKRLLIVNLASEKSCDASSLTIWVRARGPELHAGLAEPVPKACEWSFDLGRIQSPGDYVVEAKLLNLNGGVDLNPNLCRETKGVAPNGVLLRHFVGSKFYHPREACCEVCTRDPNCSSWTAPGVDDGRSDCSFFSKPNASSHTVLAALRDFKGTSGVSRHEVTSYYMGCGWSFQLTKEAPCLDPNDDRIANFGLTFHAAGGTRPQEDLPACATPEQANGPGRWIEFTDEEKGNCTKDPSLGSNDTTAPKVYPILKYSDGDRQCWYKESLNDIGKNCMEADCVMWGAGRQSISPMSHVGHFTMYRWGPYGCSLPLYDLAEIQACVDRQRIESIQVLGDSIAHFFQPYVNERLQGLQFSRYEGRTVVIDSLKVLNGIWGIPEYQWEHHINGRLNVVAKRQLLLWISGPLISSERENKITAERVQRFMKKVRQLAAGRPNIVELNYFDATAAFTYEASAQQDGMHVVGPPMKALFNMAMAAMCTATF